MRFPLLPVAICMLLSGSATHADAERQPLVYVANFNSGTVSVIDTTSNEVVSTIPVPAYPIALAVTPKADLVLVASFDQLHGEGSVSIIETAGNKLRATLQVGRSPSDVDVSPDGQHAYVTNFNSHNVSVIDLRSATVIGEIDVQGTPTAIAFAPDGETAYVAVNGGALFAVDVDSQEARPEVRIGYRAFDVATDPTRPLAYVVDPGPALLGSNGSIVEGDLRIVDASSLSVIDSVPLGSLPLNIAVDPGGRRAYVTNQTARSVSVVDLSGGPIVERRIGLGSEPLGIAVQPDSDYVYVTQAFADKVAVIDAATDTVVTEVVVGDYPMGVAVVSPEQQPETGGDGCALRAEDVSRARNLGVVFGALILLRVLRVRRTRHRAGESDGRSPRAGQPSFAKAVTNAYEA